VIGLFAATAHAMPYPAEQGPGKATSKVEKNTRTLENDLVAFRFTVTDGAVTDAKFEIKGNAPAEVAINELFSLKVEGNPVLASDMTLSVEVEEETLTAQPASPRLGDQMEGKRFTLRFSAPDKSYAVIWRPTLRDGSNYILFDVTVEALTADLDLNRLTLLDVTAAGRFRQEGRVLGSPVVNLSCFFGVHHPTAISEIQKGHLTFFWDRENMTVSNGDRIHMRATVGIYPEGQLRRAFNYYLNRERAQAYHQVLHYNAWYDILHTSREKKADEAEALERIESFTRELTEKRGVLVESFMFDDPWDNVSGTATDVWQFDPERNPNEWNVMKKVAEKHGSGLGVWMSPQGGWGGIQARLKTSRDNDLPYTIVGEAPGGKFSLSDPAYLARFREVCFDFLRNQGVNMFKFDGFNPNPETASEREALVKLIEDLRKEKPDVFINTTCGSWPSPFFLMNSDSIWRGGGDIEMKGVGPVRQQAMTHRDWVVRAYIVNQSPLFPIQSLMLCGIVLGPNVHHDGFDVAEAEEWKQETRSCFAFGVNLQELYIAPDNPDTGEAIMTDELWDIVAESAIWARANEDVLVDAHWVGGDPGQLEIYGVASWIPTKATLMLRNPSDKPQSIAIDPENVFSLPAHAKVRTFTMKSAWAEDVDKPAVTLKAGEAHIFDLEPFEVIVLERK